MGVAIGFMADKAPLFQQADDGGNRIVMRPRLGKLFDDVFYKCLFLFLQHLHDLFLFSS